MPDAIAAAAVANALRVHVFVDYWNFQLTLNESEARKRKVSDHRFKIAWEKLGPWLAAQAVATVGAHAHTFDGAILYLSYDRRTDAKFVNWLNICLSKQPGVMVEARERKPKMSHFI